MLFSQKCMRKLSRVFHKAKVAEEKAKPWICFRHSYKTLIVDF